MGGSSSKGGNQTIGYRYSFGIHMGISRGPVDELVEIRVGDKQAWPNPDETPLEEAQENPWVRLISPSSGITATPAVTEADVWAGYNGADGLHLSDMSPPFGIIYQAITASSDEPDAWQMGNWVKFEGFTRHITWDYNLEQPVSTPYDISLDGVYQIASNSPASAGGSESDGQVADIRFFISDAQYLDWVKFGSGSQISPEMKMTRVLDAAGTPVPGSGAPGSVPVEGVKVSSQIQILAPRLFGGDKSEGGIQGPLNVMMGEATQVAPAGLVSMLGEALPGYRRMFTCFFDGLVTSMNPYPKAWRFRVRRALQGWDGAVFEPGLAKIVMTRQMSEGEADGISQPEIHAMNPAHIIYECLTNREWGRGLDSSALNLPSFKQSAGILFQEGFGLCLRWTRTDSVESFVQVVLDHIGATLYQDPQTALLTIKLIRGGYKIADLPYFDPDNGLLSITDAPVAASGTYVNAIKVTYHDPLFDEDRTATVYNLASVQSSRGTFNMVSKDYPGISTPQLAHRIAERDMRTMGIELRKITATLDRRAYKVRPGDVIRVKDPSRSIRETVIRVVSYDDGTMTRGAITIVGVQDVFDMPVNGNSGQDSRWVPPSRRPCIDKHKVFEIPYAMMIRYMRPADFSYLGPESGFVGAVVGQGQQGNASYHIAVRPGAFSSEDVPTSTANFCGYEPPPP